MTLLNQILRVPKCSLEWQIVDISLPKKDKCPRMVTLVSAGGLSSQIELTRLLVYLKAGQVELQ